MQNEADVVNKAEKTKVRNSSVQKNDSFEQLKTKQLLTAKDCYMDKYGFSFR